MTDRPLRSSPSPTVRRVLCLLSALAVLAVGRAPSAAADPAPKATATVYAVAPLQHLTAGLLAGMVGSQFRYLDSYGQVLPPPKGPAERGAGDLLPEGLALMAAASPEAHQVLLAGTPAAVAVTQAWLKRIDRKPQEVILEVAVHTSPPKGVTPLTEAEGKEQLAPEGSARYAFPDGDEVTDALRIATMNLLPALNMVRIEFPHSNEFRQELLCLTPRVNGDGTITVSVAVSVTDSATGGLRRGASVLVKVKDGGTFVMGMPEGGKVAVITTSLLKDEHGG